LSSFQYNSLFAPKDILGISQYKNVLITVLQPPATRTSSNAISLGNLII